MVSPIEEYTHRITYDYDPSTGILDLTLYAVKDNERTVIMSNTVTDPVKVKALLTLLRKMKPWTG